MGSQTFSKSFAPRFRFQQQEKQKNSSPRFALEKHFELDLWVSLIGSQLKITIITNKLKHMKLSKQNTMTVPKLYIH